MAKLLFVRHGEPDYSPVTRRGWIGHGRDMAPLTEAGRDMAECVAEDPRLSGAELIVSSPYTRAMQTAAILSRRLDLNIEVETDLHEWLPDLTYSYAGEDASRRAHLALLENRGLCPPGFSPRYEELFAVFQRVKSCLLPYADRGKILVVCHAKVMRQFTRDPSIPYCGIREVDFTPDFQWHGFLPF